MWNGKLWAGDSKTVSIKREQEHQAIECKAPDFDQYLCMSYDDFKSFYDTYVLGCKEWDSGLQKMSLSELIEMRQELAPFLNGR